MIKFTMSGYDSGREQERRILGFGLSDENLKRLREGQPIFFTGEELGVPGTDFLIMHGEDEETIKHALETELELDLPEANK